MSHKRKSVSSRNAKQPPRTVFADASEAAPTYYECPQCGYLSGDPAMADGTMACPTCGAAGHGRRSFPTDRVRRLDARIRVYHDDGDSEIVVILVATLLETVLEDILDRILMSHGADVSIRRAVMDSQRSIGTRIGKLFPTLVGEEFEDAAAELGYRDFPYRWREMRQSRNAFIHDSPFNGPQERLDADMAEDSMDLLNQAYKLFVLMNNRFVADGRAH